MSAASGLDPLFLAELNERLFVQFADGRWIAPLGERHLAVLPFDEGRVGRLICAEVGDVARAMRRLGPGSGAALAAAYRAVGPMLVRLRAMEGFDDPAGDPADLPEIPALPEGPLTLLSAADTPVAQIARLLIAGADKGLLWKPAPRAAASAHLMMRVLGPLARGGLAMVQGDHASGALAAAQGGLIWASAAPVPTGLRPVLSLGATAPRHP